MVSLIEETPVLPAKNQITKATIISFLAKEKETEEPAKEIKITNTEDKASNYTMPPQPEAYIKPPRYDFL